MKQTMVFKKDYTGTSRAGQPFRTIELHDPVTLDNTTFFIQAGVLIDSTGINFRDKVEAELQMGTYNGKPTLNLIGLKKLN